jgi:hypothetical protein
MARELTTFRNGVLSIFQSAVEDLPQSSARSEIFSVLVQGADPFRIAFREGDLAR